MTSSSKEGVRRQRFDSLVAVYYPDMFRYAAWLCRDRAIAEDVVQEALLRAWKSLDSLRDDAAAKQWLLTIVRRENARYFERRRLDTVDIDNLSAAQAALLAEAPNEELADIREAIFEASRPPVGSPEVEEQAEHAAAVELDSVEASHHQISVVSAHDELPCEAR